MSCSSRNAKQLLSTERSKIICWIAALRATTWFAVRTLEPLYDFLHFPCCGGYECIKTRFLRVGRTTVILKNWHLTQLGKSECNPRSADCAKLTALSIRLLAWSCTSGELREFEWNWRQGCRKTTVLVVDFVNLPRVRQSKTMLLHLVFGAMHH